MDKILKTINFGECLDLVYETNEELERQVQVNLSRWQDPEKPLAPLSNEQLDVIYQVREVIHEKYFNPILEPSEEKPKDSRIDNFNTYIDRLIEVEREIEEENLFEHHEYKGYLQLQSQDCENLCQETTKIVEDLSKLDENYKHVSQKTDSLHNMSEQLMQHQELLKQQKNALNERLKHFTLYHTLNKSMGKFTNINSEEYVNMLVDVNTSIDYLIKHPEYKEAFNYKIRYENLLANCLQYIIRKLNHIITEATNQVMNSDFKSNLVVVESKTGSEPIVDTAFSFYYGKFQNASTKVTKIVHFLEDNIDTHDMYARTLNDFQKSYFSLRAPVMQAAVSKALLDLKEKYKTDHSILFRSSGLFIIKVCQDETSCYHYFFKNTSQPLSDYISSLCQNLYDVLRPCLITINHIEVLTELCTILKEMVNAQIQNNPALDQFVEIVNQLLQDVEERLVFRTNIFFQYDLNAYEPSPGDLAYPEKLEQMENIAEELIERRASSRASSVSLESQEVANINANAAEHFRSYTGNSPADLHGMWYPTVKRTLVCLSRLYICLDREIFQGVAQEALLICIGTIEKAADKIATRKTVLDAKLFQIKHLLIVREQIAPFQVDFTVKEMSLDFSNMKHAAIELVHNRDKIFSLNSNNAILEFLLEGTPKVKQYLVDSRKEIDKHLKAACEAFIQNTTYLLIGNLLQWQEKADRAKKMSDTYKENVIPVREQDLTKPQILAGIITVAQRNIKTKIPEIQKSMRLYLANRETEFILFRPIRNNILTAFVQLEQFLVAAKYTTDDQLLIACPTPEQLNLLICSVSLTAEQEGHVFTRSHSHSSDTSKTGN